MPDSSHLAPDKAPYYLVETIEDDQRSGQLQAPARMAVPPRDRTIALGSTTAGLSRRKQVALGALCPPPRRSERSEERHTRVLPIGTAKLGMSILSSEVGIELFPDLAGHALPSFGTDQWVALKRLAQFLDRCVGYLVGPLGKPIDHKHLRQGSVAREVHQLADEFDIGFGFWHGLAPMSGR